ncbi:GtrA family protein [Microbacterium sp. P04]|uniref:GtrA family protein n=1 Tax=Microbacterium sp. P04 TaxID=3366947 RepID=UPI003746B116
MSKEGDDTGKVNDAGVVLRVIRGAWSSRALRYLLIGGLAFLFDIGLLFLFHEVLGAALILATPAAFLISFAATYLLQRFVTFEAEGGWGASAVKYSILVAFNALATTVIVSGTEQVGWPWAIGKVAAVALTTIWNFFGYRYWIFPVGGSGSARSAPGRDS